MTTAKILYQERTVIKNKLFSDKSSLLENRTIGIKEKLKNAFKHLTPVWPLETFIACNPLQGYEHLKFEEALDKAKDQSKIEEHNLDLKAVNLHMIKWCAAFFDMGQSTIEMPHRDKGFYLSFLRLSYFDKKLHENKKELKQFLLNLPESSEQAIQLCLKQLGVFESKEEEFITQTLLYLPGWAGFVKWKSNGQSSNQQEHLPQLIDFLAVRLVLTSILWPDAVMAKGHEENSPWVREVIEQLKNNEDKYRQGLLTSLLTRDKQSKIKTKRRDAQFVFCIDVRSEPMRRVIEGLGNYETFGFAGFFGLALRTKEFETGKVKDCCPVLIKPRFHVDETPVGTDNSKIRRYHLGKRMISTLAGLYHQLKYNFASPFVLVESLGLWCGLSMLLKSLAPTLSKQYFIFLRNFIAPSPETQPSFARSASDLGYGISLKEQVSYAEKALRLMGLTSGFAKLIILCGHGGSAENNPYASALNCGACGGNQGGVNAKVFAAILNNPDVRRGLEYTGIHIPLDTVFYSALHNTTTDHVELYPLQHSQTIYLELFKQLVIDLKQARVKSNLERGIKFNSINPFQDIIRRSLDWSETRPEWGLAQNAAFIVAPRYLTKNINLDGRCFLHSYDWEEDDDGAFLETILTAPMIVAQWINAQYLFSTLDNVAYGSGSKITHNVVGLIGVMQGNASDLMHGLPLQSVMSSDSHPYHQPQRLLTVIYAPRDRILRVVKNQRSLQTLFFNEWVHLVSIDPITQMSYQLSRTGDWLLMR